MKRILIATAVILLFVWVPARAQTPPLNLSLQVTPANFTGGCPVNLTLTVKLSARQPLQEYVQFAGAPIIYPFWWLANKAANVLPLTANGAPVTITVPVSASGWVQADIVTYNPRNPRPIIRRQGTRVNYYVRCMRGVAPGVTSTQPQYQGTNPNYSNIHVNPNVSGAGNSAANAVGSPAGSAANANNSAATLATGSGAANSAANAVGQKVPQLTPQQKAEMARRQAEAKAKLAEMAKQAQANFQRYRAQFQMKQLDGHIARVNALMRQSSCSSGCQNVLQEHLKNAAQLRTTLLTTMHPVANLTETLQTYRGSLNSSQVPQIIKAGGANGAPNSGCVAPQITSISPSSGQPGDAIMITGSGFTYVNAVVFLINGLSHYPRIAFGNDSQVITSVPAISGLQQTQAYISVQSCGQSNAVPFTFQPQMEVGLLPAQFVQGDENYTISDGSICDDQTAGVFVGHKGDLFINSGYQLGGGWVLDHLAFFVDPAPPDNHFNGAETVGDQIGSQSAFVQVHWWTSAPLGSVGYCLGVYVSGPVGLGPTGLITQ